MLNKIKKNCFDMKLRFRKVADYKYNIYLPTIHRYPNLIGCLMLYEIGWCLTLDLPVPISIIEMIEIKIKKLDNARKTKQETSR